MFYDVAESFPGKAPQSLSSPGQQKRGHPLDNLKD